MTDDDRLRLWLNGADTKRISEADWQRLRLVLADVRAEEREACAAWIRGFADQKHPIERGEILLSPATRGVLVMVAEHFEARPGKETRR